MAITKAKKDEIVKFLQEKVAQAPAVVFVNFHGLTVELATQLRKNLRAKSVGLTVAKKTLVRRALAGGKLTGEMPALEGEIALAYSPAGATGDELIDPAREVGQFAKQFKDQLKIAGGVWEGGYVDAATMMTIATIPGREVLYGKLVNIINSPIQRLVWALAGAAAKK